MLLIFSYAGVAIPTAFLTYRLLRQESFAQESTGRYQEQLIEDWKRLQQIDTHPRVYRVIHRTVLQPSYPPLHILAKTRPDRWLVKTTHQNTSAIFAQSPRYAFLLWKRDEKSDWTLRHLLEEPGSSAAKRLEEATCQSAIRYPLSTVFLIPENDEPKHQTIYALSQNPRFRILRVTPVTPEQDSVDFDCGNLAGHLRIDRALGSVIVYSKIQGPGASPTAKPWMVEMKQRQVTRPHDVHHSLQCDFIEFASYIQGELEQHETYQFSDYSYEPIADEEYTLSYYGFPEPVDITPPPRRWPRYVGFIAAAIILALLAITFRYLARHRSPPRATSDHQQET